MGSSARLGHPLGLGPGLRSPYLIQSSEFYRRGESTQTAPSKGHAAIEPSHDMKGHRILKEPRIQHPSPFPLYLRRDEGHPTDVSVGLRSCCPLTAIPVPELGSIVRVRVPTNRRFLPHEDHHCSPRGSRSDRLVPPFAAGLEADQSEQRCLSCLVPSARPRGKAAMTAARSVQSSWRLRCCVVFS